MSFSILFHNTDKTFELLKPEAVSMESLDPSNFAWLNFDLEDSYDVTSFICSLGIPEEIVRNALYPGEPFYYRHHQKYLIDLVQVCQKEGDTIGCTPLVIAMNDRAIVTAHRGPSTYVERVLYTYEESFKSVGRTPGFIYFLFWDAMVDGFLPQVFSIDERLEQLEVAYLKGDKPEGILDEILGAKQMVRSLKNSLSPMQRSMRHLVAAKLELIHDEAHKYLRGIFDHMDSLGATIDSLQERVHATLAGYNSLLSQQINSSMKVLTIIATIMMPLSLLAGIYGTNFENIPELKVPYAYFLFLGLLVALALAMLFMFKKKKWL
ncbi:MAG: hypothetical protein HY788_22500 [Deltaproteobacteria bacterium]|nr:hypothetical protein [Deltaproteobacteria bacterium]